MSQKLRKASLTSTISWSRCARSRRWAAMNSILSMMPGMSQMKGNLEIDEKSMDRVEAIILSMTKAERSNPSLLNRRESSGSPRAPEWISRK